MLPKTAEYALRVSVCLAQSPDKLSAADELAEVTKIPRRYLHKVVQDLARKGLVRSQPGPGGGYSIDKAPKQITILDVVNAVAPLEAHSPLPAWSDFAHATLSAASRARQGLR